MFLHKKYNIALLIFTVVVSVVVYTYWQLNCVSGNCSFELRNEWLRPIAQACIYLSTILVILLLFPQKYFQIWFTYIFSWALPVSVLLVVATQDSGEVLSISKTQTVQLLGAAFGLVTVILILVLSILDWKRRS